MNQKATLFINFKFVLIINLLQCYSFMGWFVFFFYLILVRATIFLIWHLSTQQLHLVAYLINFHIHRGKKMKLNCSIKIFMAQMVNCFYKCNFVSGLEAQLPTEMQEINVLEDLHLDHVICWVSAHC